MFHNHKNHSDDDGRHDCHGDARLRGSPAFALLPEGLAHHSFFLHSGGLRVHGGCPSAFAQLSGGRGRARPGVRTVAAPHNPQPVAWILGPTRIPGRVDRHVDRSIAAGVFFLCSTIYLTSIQRYLQL